MSEKKTTFTPGMTFVERLVAAGEQETLARLGLPKVRPLNVIAAEISRLWEKPYFGAVPFINAMRSLSSVSDRYGYEDGETVVLYFLANASTWRGDDARRIKAELKKAMAAK